jgi:hypothetical protein
VQRGPRRIPFVSPPTRTLYLGNFRLGDHGPATFRHAPLDLRPLGMTGRTGRYDDSAVLGRADLPIMSNRKDIRAVRAREEVQATRIRESLQEIRPHFGWTFGIVSFTLLGFSLLHFYSRFIRGGELSHFSTHENWRTLVVCCVLFGAGVVFGMAWWTTRKVRPPKRAWGIAASLLSLVAPLYVYFARKPFRVSEWEIMAYGALALFIYGWPDRWARTDD